jgi:fibronectin type 3 domain-containing protein
VLVQATVPSAPQSLTATGSNGSVSLSWNAPSSDGGSPITGYDVYRGTSPGGESATALATNVSTRNFTDASAVNGTAYYYTVAAVNAVGVSPQSNEASATPQATVASVPSGLVASGGNGSVVLSWAVPVSDGGSPITGYDVYRGTSPGGESATPVATNVATTGFTDTGVVNGTTYYYRVAAVNGVGVSPQSGEASATPKQPATAPSAPQGLAATGGNGSVKLSWSAPSTDGGSPVTGYDVYRGTSPGGESATPVATSVAGTSYTDTGLANGTKYYYTVAAVNAVGVSPQSNEASATPQAPSAAAFVRRVGSVTASSSRTTTTVPVSAPGVAAGHTLVVSLLLSSTRSLTGAVSATDSAGDSYVVARDTNDGSAGDRTVVLVSVGVKALAAGGSITLTYPSSAETHVSVDEFSGITGIDTSSGATGTTAAFSSGTAPATTQATDVLVGVIGTESGKAPTWAKGWTVLPVLSISSDYLDTVYQMATASGSYAATGTVGGQWMASIVTLKTS